MSRITLLLFALTTVAAAQAPSLPGPDQRYNADLLLVVAHPDDETGGVAGYLARAIYDQHRRVAVVFVNRGQSGGNAAGAEEGNALGSEREIEGRRALASFGVANVWFLDTPNVSSQNVMNSLERWGHGAVLEEVVRLVRLTRPEVILTWLPAFVAGENHADHQAAAVIATEAFDMAKFTYVLCLHPRLKLCQVDKVSPVDGKGFNLLGG
jgi:LmbE family N-acetylglucosaminyl deacetylase